MAPFLLTVSKEGPPESRNKRIIFTENIYNPIVKVTGWQNEREGHPKDNDPYRPFERNLHLATYNRLGCFPDEPLQSTTHAMLEDAIKYKNDYYIPNTNKYMVNYYAFHETL
ncbi:uncharacterized protein LOC108738113 isoform X2 [Agrilus planipennis]|uniref:Uncharacterized protein LOC108738113 isoform X2 n=1 Tax=Agrilus planipennis TaxID=224129 RepID=A0A7F5QWM6_AGRPL|nr:uncharacterized protein LOC108738113 isoform X2 [Agrilus planipennis]